MKSRRQQREAAVAKKRAKGKLRKSHEFGKMWPMNAEQMKGRFMTGAGELQKTDDKTRNRPY